MGYYPTPVRKQVRNNKCWQEYEEKGTLDLCWWECKLVRPLGEAVWEVLKKKKKKVELPFIQQFCFMDKFPKKIKQTKKNEILCDLTYLLN